MIDDSTVDVSDWLAVQPGDWIRAERQPWASTGCEAFQGVVISVDEGYIFGGASVLVNEVRRYWANWKLVERRPAA